MINGTETRFSSDRPLDIFDSLRYYLILCLINDKLKIFLLMKINYFELWFLCKSKLQIYASQTMKERVKNEHDSRQKMTIFFSLPLRFIGYLSASEIRLIKMVATYTTVYSPLYTPILVLCWCKVKLLLLLILRDDKLVFLTLGLNWGLLSLSSSTVIPTIDVEDNPP